jgi:hypothetical protein
MTAQLQRFAAAPATIHITFCGVCTEQTESQCQGEEKTEHVLLQQQEQRTLCRTEPNIQRSMIYPTFLAGEIDDNAALSAQQSRSRGCLEQREALHTLQLRKFPFFVVVRVTVAPTVLLSCFYRGATAPQFTDSNGVAHSCEDRKCGAAGQRSNHGRVRGRDAAEIPCGDGSFSGFAECCGHRCPPCKIGRA